MQLNPAQPAVLAPRGTGAGRGARVGYPVACSGLLLGSWQRCPAVPDLTPRFLRPPLLTVSPCLGVGQRQ